MVKRIVFVWACIIMMAYMLFHGMFYAAAQRMYVQTSSDFEVWIYAIGTSARAETLQRRCEADSGSARPFQQHPDVYDVGAFPHSPWIGTYVERYMRYKAVDDQISSETRLHIRYADAVLTDVLHC